MSCINNRNKHLAYNEYEPPTKKIISEGDILIKDLVKKQQRTDIKLQEYLQKKTNFEKFSEQVSVTTCCSGTLPLKNFETALQQLEKLEDLKAYNLTNEDAKLILDYRNGKMHDEYKNIEPNVLQSRIVSLLRIITEHNQKFNKNNKDMSRNISHKQNEALAFKPDSIETKLLKFALENKNDHPERLPHPMDNIKDLESNLFSHLHEEKLMPSKIRKRLRRYANRLKTTTVSTDSASNDLTKKENNIFVSNSKWDLIDAEPINVHQSSIPKNYTCKPCNYYTIKDGEIIKLTDNGSVRKNEIEVTKQLTIEEIKALPKFKTYSPGIPSNILYLKNLPKHIEEKDLQTIFAEFTSTNTLLFKIMNGKMRGQAFITFPDTGTAASALETINGVLLNGKPIIIEFGRKIL